MYYTIYKTTNLINGKYYIGKHQTEDLNDGYPGSGKILKRAIRKYGVENFITEILYIFDNEKQMNTAERILVVVDPETNYNICPGGKGGFGYINSNGLNGLGDEVRRLGRKAADKVLLEKYGPNWRVDCLTAEERSLKSVKSANTAKARQTGIFDPLNIEKRNQILVSDQVKIKRKKTLSEIGHQKGSKNSNFGKCWITDGINNAIILKSEEIPSGWSLGRTIESKPKINKPFPIKKSRIYGKDFSDKMSMTRLRSNPNNSDMELIANIKEDRSNGMKIRDIASKYGVDKSWICRLK